MGKLEKLYEHILMKISDSNVSFESYGKGKPYQIKQAREIILKYNIRIGE